MPSPMFSHVGMEWEGVCLSRDTVMSLLNSYIPNQRELIRDVQHDASVESPCFDYGKLSVLLNVSQQKPEIFARARTYVTGFELITNPLNELQRKRFAYTVIPLLTKNGELGGPRSSLHFHVGSLKRLKTLKNYVALGLRLDPLFFRLAGLGRQFRGYINSSIFCRPLSSMACVLSDEDRWYRIDAKESLNARNEREFWEAFGLQGVDEDRLVGDVDRYVPLRYVGTNFYSLLLHGTLELRHCNNTNVPSWITALAHLTQAVTEVGAFATLRDILELPTVDINEKDDHKIFRLLDAFLDLSKYAEIENNRVRDDISILHSIINNTPHPNVLIGDVKTHAIRFRYDDDFMRGNFERVLKPADSGHIDIHSFRIER